MSSTLSALPRDQGWVVPAPQSRVAQAGTRIEVMTGVLVALGYLAAVGSGATTLAVGFLALALTLALIWPTAGLVVLATILPMREPDLLQPVYVDAIVLGATGVGMLLRPRWQRTPPRIHPALWLAFGYGLLSLVAIVPLVNGYPSDWLPSAALQAIRILSAIAIFVVGVLVFRQTSSAPILGAALIGGFLAAVLALMAFWRVGPLSMVSGLLALPSAEDLAEPIVAARANGGFATANYLGFFAAQYALLGIGVWPLTPRRLRPALVLVVATVLAALVVSFSRSAYIGLALGVLILIAYRRPRLAIALGVTAALGALILYPMFLEARVSGADAFDPKVLMQRAQSEEWRRLAVDAGLQMFAGQPVFGVGFGMFQRLSPAFIGGSPATASHNAFVQILAEQGAVGVAMVAGIVLSLFVALLQSGNSYRRAGIAMLSTYLFQSLFINSTQSIQGSGLLWLVMAAALWGAGRRLSPSPKEIP